MCDQALHHVDTMSVSHRPQPGVSSAQKHKPVAMIAASRPASSASSVSFSDFVQDLKSKTGLGPNELLSSASTCSLHSNSSFASEADASSIYSSTRISYSAQPFDASSIYATLKRNKRLPPPPPLRTNSVRSAHGHRDYGPAVSTSRIPDPSHSNVSREPLFDAMQEQAFATCVKSLASRFSQMASVEDEAPGYASLPVSANPGSRTWRGSEDTFPPPPPPLHSADKQHKNQSLGSNEFPPPPSPLCQESLLSFGSNRIQSPDRSLSSCSSESLPFANDNMGTIRQSSSHPHHFENHLQNDNLTAITDTGVSVASCPKSAGQTVG